MPRYLLVARDDNAAFASLSPAEAQAVIQKYMAWTEGLKNAGHLRAGEKLKDGEGRVMARRGGRLQVTDGPFVETREILGGFWILEAPDYEAVTRLCETSPHLAFGSIEVRAIEEL